MYKVSGKEKAGAQPESQPWGRLLTQHTGHAEAQVLFVRKLQDVVAEEQGDVCLEVEVSHEAAEVQWLKQGVLLQPSSKYLLQESGCRRTLTIRCLGPADRGTYRCESLHDRTQAKLHVEREYRLGMGLGMGTGRAPNCCNGSMWAELVLGWKGCSERWACGQGWESGTNNRI